MTATNRQQITIPILIFVIGMLISVGLLMWLSVLQDEKISREFSRVAGDRCTFVTARLQQDYAVLETVRQLYEANDWENEAEFTKYTAPILQKTPEMDALAWATSSPTEDGKTELKVIYQKSQLGRRLEVGSQLSALPGLQTAIANSLKSGQTTWVNLKNASDKNAPRGRWLLVLPLYGHEPTPNNGSYALAGVLLAQVDMYRLIEGVFQDLERIGIDTIIYDGPVDPKNEIVTRLSATRQASYDPVREKSANAFAFSREIQIGSRQWMMYCRPAPAFLERYATWEPWLALVGCGLLSVLMALYELRQRLSAHALRQQNEIVILLESVAVAANEAKTNDELLGNSLRLICQNLDWPFGHVFEADPQSPERLRSSGLFVVRDEERFAYMRAETEKISFEPGEGMPGRVSVSGKPIFIPELDKFNDFRRQDAAKECGLKSCFAFPVIVRQKVAAVLEFFNTDSISKLEGWQDLLASMSTQISHAMERRLAADELLEKTVLLENAVEGIARLDRFGVYLSVNKAYAQICGKPAAELIGRNRREMAHPEDESRFTAAYIQMVTQGRAQVEGRLIRPDGSVYHQEITIIREMNNLGHLQGCVLFSRDITERVEQQRALRESEERFIAFMANNPACASIKDEESRLMYVNPAFTEQFGIGFHEAIGKTPEELTQPEEAKVIRESDRATLASNRPMNLVEVFPDLEGRSRHWLVYKFLMKGRDGKRLLGVLSLDITERMEAEEAIIEARDEALESARLKSQFLANMSHEIRTPMNGLIGMLGLLNRTDLEPSQRELLQTAAGASDSLLRLLNDILDFSKIEAGKMEIDPIIFDPRQCLRHAVKILAEPASKKGLRVASEVAANVPPQIFGDSGRLSQIFVNLLNNGIKFTEQGSVTASLALERRLEGKKIVLHGSVTDTGIGVEESHRDLIFQPFRQSDNSTARQYGGTGLGLAICSQLVGLMGGRIWIEGVPTGGSAFHFTVEMEESLDSVPALPANQPVLPKAEHSLRILLAEDNEINQRIAMTLLKDRGHFVVLARDGHEAVEHFQKSRFDLILMDVQMPGKDGYQATLDIRQDPKGKDIPIYAVTAHAMPEDRRRCLDVGMNDYLTKPIRVEEFARLVEAKVKRNHSLVLPPTSPTVVKTRRIDWQPQRISVVKTPEIPDDAKSFKAFNLQALRQVVNFNDDLVRQLAASFINQATEDRGQMRRALAEGNGPVLERSAHRLKGSALSLSAAPLAEVTQVLETASRTQDFEKVGEVWEDFETSLASLITELDTLRG